MQEMQQWNLGELRSQLGEPADWECRMKKLHKRLLIPENMQDEVHSSVAEHASFKARTQIGLELQPRANVGRIRAFIIGTLTFQI